MHKNIHFKELVTKVGVAAWALSACVLTLTQAAAAQVAAPTSQAAANDDPMAKVANLLDKPAPEFTVMTLDGKPVSLADYKGKAVIVNFWATWCAGCKLEMPWLAQLREQYAAQGLEVLGIVTDGAPDEKVRALASKYGAKYPILHCNHKTAQAYGGLPYLPESFYIDKHGKLVLEGAAADTKDELEANVRKLLGLGGK
jgi:thiol-disulfide isomerase/thioredoxin